MGLVVGMEEGAGERWKRRILRGSVGVFSGVRGVAVSVDSVGSFLFVHWAMGCLIVGFGE